MIARMEALGVDQIILQHRGHAPGQRKAECRALALDVVNVALDVLQDVFGIAPARFKLFEQAPDVVKLVARRLDEFLAQARQKRIDFFVVLKHGVLIST